MTRVALYARYSSDNQRDASIEDQLRQCRERAAREGWTVVETYSDRAISGASLIRSGIQSLLTEPILTFATVRHHCSLRSISPQGQSSGSAISGTGRPSFSF